MADTEHLVGEAAERGTSLTLDVAELAPKRILEILGQGGRSHRMTLELDGGSITVEIGNGLIVGATARLDGESLSGKAAYARIRGVTEGTIQIEPLRFPSLANILEPTCDLPDLGSAAPLPGEPTIELALPEARPDHQDEPRTVELDLDDVPEREEAPKALAVPPPPPPAALPPTLPPTRIRTAPPQRHAWVRWGLASVAAAGLLGFVGLALALAPRADEAQTAPGPTATAPTEVGVEEPADEHEAGEVDMDLSPRDVSRAQRQRARDLARRARAAIRDGERQQALTAAREAADLRGGLPYYQVVLGDALRLNGRRAAALRAYRRAVRLRPGYTPAMRRIERLSSHT